MTTATDTELIDLLRRALASPKDTDLLAEVQRRSNEMRAVIRRKDVDLPDLATAEAVWVRAVMIAVDPELAAVRVLEGDPSHEQGAGEYFASLVRKAPNQARFSEFAHLRPIPAAAVMELLATPAAVAAGTSAVRPAMYGLTPVTFVYAAQAVSNVVYRARHENGEVFVAVEDIRENDLVREIVLTCECRIHVATALFRWLMNTADVVRDIFPGFVIVRIGETMRFVSTVGTTSEKSNNEIETAMLQAADGEEDQDYLGLTR